MPGTSRASAASFASDSLEESLAEHIRPEIRELEPNESEALLERNFVGRMAYIHEGRAEIVPIGYAYEPGVIYARTSPGQKLSALQHDDRVSFEVDEVKSPLEWRSVVAHCLFRPLRPVGSGATMEAWERAVAQLAAIIPGTMTSADPAAHRWFVFQLEVQDLTGLTSRPSS
jgi:nitroimidazol reductase NimA-like FMN-containing flavoprotein (pyridoxamine 5'-phosphate oxidase superfamily)